MTEGSSYLVLPREASLGEVDVGIDAERVMRVVDEADWTGDRPIDPYLELGVVRGELEPPYRVIVVRTAGGATPIRTAGKLTVRPVDRRLVQPLPPVVLVGAAQRALGGIAFTDGERALLVLEVDGLVRA